MCNHEWKVLSETVTKSKYEDSLKVSAEVLAKSVNLPHQLCCADRKHIQIVVCDKCGKLKRFVEDI